MIRGGDHAPRLDDEGIVVFAAAHRRRPESGAELDPFDRGNREHEVRQGRLHGIEERLAHARGEARDRGLDDAADAVPVLPGRLDLRDHAIRRVQVRTPDRRALHVRLNLGGSHGLGDHTADLGRMGVEPDLPLPQEAAGDRTGHDERGGHASRQLTTAAQVALPAVLSQGGEVSVSRPRHARDVRVRLRLHVLVPDDRDDRFAGCRTAADAFRELHAVFLLPLGREQALSGAAAVQLGLDELRVHRRPGAEALDRAPDERAVARPEDRRPVTHPDRVHPTTACNAPRDRRSSRNVGYETRKHQGSELSTGPSAARPATAAAMRTRWSPRASTNAPRRRLPLMNRDSPTACVASTARTGNRSGVSPTSTVCATRSPPRARTRSASTSMRAPKERRASTTRRSPCGPSTSRPETVTSPPVSAAAARGNAAEEKSPGTSTSIGTYLCPPGPL